MSYARVAGVLGASAGWTICILFAVDLVRSEISVAVDSDVAGTRFAIISETPLSRRGRLLVTPATFQVRAESLRVVFVAEGAAETITVSVTKRGWRSKASAIIEDLRSAEIDVTVAGVKAGTGLDAEGKLTWPRSGSASMTAIQLHGGVFCSHPLSEFYARRGLLRSALVACDGYAPLDLEYHDTPDR